VATASTRPTGLGHRSRANFSSVKVNLPGLIDTVEAKKTNTLHLQMAARI
jgi:hypothetical protein